MKIHPTFISGFGANATSKTDSAKSNLVQAAGQFDKGSAETTDQIPFQGQNLASPGNRAELEKLKVGYLEQGVDRGVAVYKVPDGSRSGHLYAEAYGIGDRSFFDLGEADFAGQV